MNTRFGRKRTQVGRKKASHTNDGRKNGISPIPPYMCILFTPLHCRLFVNTWFDLPLFASEEKKR
jgi:hypothetical protein